MIALFDSGVGGLTVLREVRKLLPQYDYAYFGDTARVPYGGRSQETIYTYVTEALEFLAGKGVKLVILACNTASAEALRRIQQEWLPTKHPDMKVLGVLIPTAEEAVQRTVTGRIGVIATRSTVASQAYDREITKLLPEAQVISQACPLLVPLIEEGWAGKPETRMVLKKYLRPLKSHNVDTLILGCTHYPFVQRDIERIMGKDCTVIPSSIATAQRLEEYLARHPEVEQTCTKNGSMRYFVTDDAARFEELGKNVFGMDIRKNDVERVTL